MKKKTATKKSSGNKNSTTKRTKGSKKTLTAKKGRSQDLASSVVPTRTVAEIQSAFDDYWGVMWWILYQNRLTDTERNELDIVHHEQRVEGADALIAALIEQENGLEKLESFEGTDFDQGVAYGRLTALAWLCGTEWEEPLQI